MGVCLVRLGRCLAATSAPTCLSLRDGAGDGIRTRDIQLGRLELYQLSYTRDVPRFEWRGKDSNLRRRMAGRFTVCSLWPLGNPSFYVVLLSVFHLRAGDRIRTDDLLLTRQLLYRLSYASQS